jgi:hypothetical protein
VAVEVVQGDHSFRLEADVHQHMSGSDADDPAVDKLADRNSLGAVLILVYQPGIILVFHFVIVFWLIGYL